jgi:hypothetical protein
VVDADLVVPRRKGESGGASGGGLIVARRDGRQVKERLDGPAPHDAADDHGGGPDGDLAR